MEGAPGSENRIAFSIRVPVGIIAAITPFNVPLNLVCHKVGPVIEAGNAVILKPSEPTPIVSLKLAELFAEAGLPAGRLNVVTGVGPDIGIWLVENPKVFAAAFFPPAAGIPVLLAMLLQHPLALFFYYVFKWTEGKSASASLRSLLVVPLRRITGRNFFWDLD